MPASTTRMPRWSRHVKGPRTDPGLGSVLECGRDFARGIAHGLERPVDDLAAVLKGNEPGAPLQHANPAAQQRQREARIAGLVGAGEITIAASRRIEPEGNMEYQLKAGDLCLDA